MRALVLAAVVVVALPLTAHTQSLGMQSDWLETVKGHRDGKTGAQVMDVTEDPSTGTQTVMVKIPKAAMDDEGDMEEVKVIGRAPEKAEIPELFPELETEWVDDYDNDHYGLIIRFTKDQKIPFRLFFSAQGQGGAIDGGVQP